MAVLVDHKGDTWVHIINVVIVVLLHCNVTPFYASCVHPHIDECAPHQAKHSVTITQSRQIIIDTYVRWKQYGRMWRLDPPLTALVWVLITPAVAKPLRSPELPLRSLTMGGTCPVQSCCDDPHHSPFSRGPFFFFCPHFRESSIHETSLPASATCMAITGTNIFPQICCANCSMSNNNTIFT